METVELGIPRGHRCRAEHPHDAYYRGRDGRVVCRTCRAERNRRYHQNNRARASAMRLGRLRRQNARERRGPEGCRRGMVPNGPLREAVEREMRANPELSFEEIALRAGWVRKDSSKTGGDSSTVKRALGLEARREKNGTIAISRTCREETALRIAHACHIFPWEIGL
jgi:hypothetical protein